MNLRLFNVVFFSESTVGVGPFEFSEPAIQTIEENCVVRGDCPNLKLAQRYRRRHIELRIMRGYAPGYSLVDNSLPDFAEGRQYGKLLGRISGYALHEYCIPKFMRHIAQSGLVGRPLGHHLLKVM